MTDTATLQARLTEAEAALHDLRIGRGIVQVRSADGEMVTYQPGDAARLSAYINGLKRQLGQRPRGQAIGVNFR